MPPAQNLFRAIVLGTLFLPCAAPAAVTAEFNGTNLRIDVTSPDSLTVTVVGGIVKFNGADATTGPVDAFNVNTIDANLDSAGGTHDLSLISSSTCPNLGRIFVSIDADNQTIIGGNVTQDFFVRGDNNTILGGAGSDLCSVLPTTSGTTFDGGIEYDSITFIATDSNETITLEPGVADSLIIKYESNTLIDAANVERIMIEAGPGNDSVSVTPGIMTPLTVIQIDPGGGNDALDFASSPCRVVYDRFFFPGDDSIVAPLSQDAPLQIQLQIYQATNPETFTLSDDGTNQKVSMTGDLVGSVSYNRAESILIYGGAADDIFDFPNPAGFGLALLSLVGNGGDDQFNIVMSADVEHRLDGSGETVADLAKIDRNGFAAVLDSGVVTAPGAMPVELTSIEDVMLIGAAPSPTASPTPTPQATATATPTATPTVTLTATGTPTLTPTATPSPTPTGTTTPSPSPSPSTTGTPTPQATATAAPSATPTPSVLNVLLGTSLATSQADINADGLIDAADLLD